MPAVLLSTLNEDLKENTLKKRKGGGGGGRRRVQLILNSSLKDDKGNGAIL